VKPLPCGHSLLGLDLLTWMCWCGAKAPDPPHGLKSKRKVKRRIKVAGSPCTQLTDFCTGDSP